MFNPASSSKVSSCVRSVRKSLMDGLSPCTPFVLPLPFVVLHRAPASASCSAKEASSLAWTRSAKRTAASLLTTSRTCACACPRVKWRRAAASPRRMPSSRPRGAPVHAKPASKPSCSAASLPADMPSRYPAYPRRRCTTIGRGYYYHHYLLGFSLTVVKFVEKLAHSVSAWCKGASLSSTQGDSSSWEVCMLNGERRSFERLKQVSTRQS